MNKDDAKNNLLDYMADNITQDKYYAIHEKVNISAAILKKRLELNMNQKQFAKFMQVSQGMISKWESAEYNFTIEAISNICYKLNLIFHIEITEEEKKQEYMNAKIHDNRLSVNG